MSAWEYDLDDVCLNHKVAQKELAALRKCCSQRGARLQILRGAMRETDWLHFVQDYPPAADWFDDDGVPR